ncbi:putative transcriptional regulator [Halopolyspora algeriensis]|uniref:Putative transcriptional regulator n=1 Tax=Halopolyspora algeriensis TaxID=1500506 RepID=A0A368VS07_9ACTN|nr:BlaI/MecI/CopY family transcriptional regulator [Halopolyspora algeriensis]RCW44465.1 putative transcriptional regulator [Halopolyspora algeriensis]TQM55826.1 putative transcriptional regulator [Halopolyspora algeriensis]
MLGLGELELKVMDVLWAAREPLRVRDVLEHLSDERKLAYTTVMTVLDHLHTKGWVRRTMSGRAYHYTPARSREEAGAGLLREVLDSSGDAESVLLHFARSVSERESELLRRALNQSPEQPDGGPS